MADSLRDQLLKSGLVKQVRDEKSARPGKGRKRRGGGRRKEGGGSAEELDLARAYAMRAQAEAEERRRVQREAEEQARQRRELRRRLAEALEGQTLNKADAELMRHFEYGGKIRRVHVDAEQLQALNRGELGVIQMRGRYLLVTRERAQAIAAFAADHVALLVDPDAPAPADGVPDDLVW